MTSIHRQESSYVLGFADVDRAQVAVVGGKGAQLGELSRLAGLQVPPGFCVTTDAFRRVVAQARSLDASLDRLARLAPGDRDAIRALAAELRDAVERSAIPDEIATAITGALAGLGAREACAVRSSATAEDAPTASFAGQHDSYLNVVGVAAVLDHVRRCWASLYTERAVSYRVRHNLDHRAVHMAVVVQRMVAADAAGVLFTADPVTGNRTLASIEASAGLGEALVSGRVNPDVYQVRDDAVVATTLAGERPVLTAPQAVELAQLGRRIEAHLGAPQDVEWCLAGGAFHVVQSRPITTLFPIPARDDRERHVYICVGHQQMMTDPMRPLGLSLFQLTAARPMYEAGGRLFVDVTEQLATPASRAALMALAGRSDALIGDALQIIVDRGDFLPARADPAPGGPARVAPTPIATDPAIVAALIERTEASLGAVKRDIQGKTGAALVDFIRADLAELQRILFDPQSFAVIMAGIEASWWLNDHLQAWLGETNAADTLTLSVPGNVTSEMGLALLEVADVIRPHPEVVAFLHHVADDDFVDALVTVPGGREARDAIRGFLDRYGMRCVGEIDITRPRWSERPSTLVPMLLANIKNFAPGAGARRFADGQRAAAEKEQELLERLRALPDGAQKADQVKQMIDRVRTFIGYREYPKYGKVSRYFVYRQALLAEADRLVQAHVLAEEDDLFYLTIPELHAVVRTHQVDAQLIAARKDAYTWQRTLTPPRVLTSDGEVIAGAYRRGGLPAGALVGNAVSGGIVTGRARVILDVADAELEPGDILVTRYTDPSWTPVFVAIAGLVTEVGGVMSHGAVIAREYGVPTVVGVEHATRLIRDGARIRVHGADGYVEILG